MSWANVPKDVLSLILTLLNLADLGNATAVCSSWRWIVRQQDCLSARQLPWLMQSRHPETSASTLLRSLGTPNTGDAPRRRHRCCGVHGHWLAVADDAGSLFLLHPLLGARVELPPQSTLPLNNIRLPAPPSYYYKSAHFVQKVVLSSPPTQAGCMAAFIFMGGELAVCNVGDSRWTAAAFGPVGPRRRVIYQDIAFYKGELVAVDATEKAWAFGFRSGRLIRRRPLAPRTWWDPYNRPNQFWLRHLVVMDGRLLMVVRERSLVVDWSNVRTIKTTNFRTLMLEDSDELVRYWTPLHGGIGNHVMFLGRSISVVADATRVGEPFLGDCIYFAEPEVARAERMEDMGWFHMPFRTLFFENGRGGGGGVDRPKKVPIFHWMFNYGWLSS